MSVSTSTFRRYTTNLTTAFVNADDMKVIFDSNRQPCKQKRNHFPVMTQKSPKEKISLEKSLFFASVVPKIVRFRRGLLIVWRSVKAKYQAWETLRLTLISFFQNVNIDSNLIEVSHAYANNGTKASNGSIYKLWKISMHIGRVSHKYSRQVNSYKLN